MVLPKLVLCHWWKRLLHNQTALRLKSHLKKRPWVTVIVFPVERKDGDETLRTGVRAEY